MLLFSFKQHNYTSNTYSNYPLSEVNKPKSTIYFIVLIMISSYRPNKYWSKANTLIKILARLHEPLHTDIYPRALLNTHSITRPTVTGVCSRALLLKCHNTIIAIIIGTWKVHLFYKYTRSGRLLELQSLRQLDSVIGTSRAGDGR